MAAGFWLLKYDDGLISRGAARRADKTAKTDKRFAYLNMHLEINDPDISKTMKTMMMIMNNDD
jgi:hypothetical protein